LTIALSGQSAQTSTSSFSLHPYSVAQRSRDPFPHRPHPPDQVPPIQQIKPTWWR